MHASTRQISLSHQVTRLAQMCGVEGANVDSVAPQWDLKPCYCLDEYACINDSECRSGPQRHDEASHRKR